MGATHRCGARASHCSGFSCCGPRALGTWAPVVVAHGLSSCGSRASLLRGMWDLSRSGLKPTSPALAGGFFYLFIYLFMAVLGLRFCARAFSSCSKRGPLFIVVRGPLTIAASLVAEHRLQMRRLSSCGSRAQLLCGMWDLPRLGIEPVSPALAGRFSTTAPPGKPGRQILNHCATKEAHEGLCKCLSGMVCQQSLQGLWLA